MKIDINRFRESVVVVLPSWTIVSFLLLLATALGSCSVESMEPDDQYVEPQLPEGHNVAILANSSVSTKTALEDDLRSTAWSADDKVALWAIADSQEEFTLEAATFSLYYYGMESTTAIFTANIDEMTDDTYTYYSLYPLPKAVDGDMVTYNIPSIQSGYYDGVADIMTSGATRGAALTGTASKNCEFSYSHLAHAIRIEIPEERDLLGGTTRLEVTFPQDVVGDVSFSFLEEQPQMTLSEGSRTIYVDMEQEISSEGYIWLFINPTTITGEIEFVGYTASSAPSAPITTTLDGREMEAGAITPIVLTIPQEAPKCFTIAIAENNLGEDVESITLTAPSGACFVGDESSIVLGPNDVGEFEFSYMASLYESLFKAEGIAISYESQSAIVEGEALMITDEHNGASNYISCTVPYLFEEDFALVASNSGDSDGTALVDGYDNWTLGSHYQFWQGYSVAIKAYNGSWSSSFTNSSLVLSSIPTIKPGASLSLEIEFAAGWSKSACGGMNLTVGDSSVSLDNDSSVSYNNIPDIHSATASQVDNSTSISWTTSAQSASFFSSGHESVYIDNIKIKIAENEEL